MTLDLEALKKLAGRATEGPWQWVNPRTDELRAPGEYSSSLRTVAEFKSAHGDYTLPKFILEAEEIRSDNMEANAAFIAASREAVPALIAEVERLREALAFYACVAEMCDCDLGKEQADRVTCGYRARAALSPIPPADKEG